MSTDGQLSGDFLTNLSPGEILATVIQRAAGPRMNSGTRFAGPEN